MSLRYVVDSSVCNKLYLQEPGREQAQNLFVRASRREVELLAPDLLCLEVLSTAQRCKVPLASVVSLLESLRSLLLIRPINANEYQAAIEIMQQGHEKSGYPSIYDSIFHAMAFCNDAVLITADQRHYDKTSQLGKVVRLSEWMG